MIQKNNGRVKIQVADALYHEVESTYAKDKVHPLPLADSFPPARTHGPWVGYRYYADFQGQGPALELFTANYKEIRLGKVASLDLILNSAPALFENKRVHELPAPIDPNAPPFISVEERLDAIEATLRDKL